MAALDGSSGLQWWLARLKFFFVVPNELKSPPKNNMSFYLGSWCHLSVKIFCLRCNVKTFRDQTYICMEAIYQISAQSETWINTVSEGEVLAPFT